MNTIERKYDPYFTRSFESRLKKVNLNEFEKKVFEASIDYFCTSLDKTRYNPLKVSEELIFYEFEVVVFQRVFKVVFEVDGIDAFALDIEELWKLNQFLIYDFRFRIYLQSAAADKN